MSPNKLVNSLICAPLDEALEAHGFEGKALVFRREVEGVKQVVAVQIQKGELRGDPAQGAGTVSVRR